MYNSLKKALSYLVKRTKVWRLLSRITQKFMPGILSIRPAKRFIECPERDIRAIGRFIDDFRENYIPIKLTRIGGNGDGGYLVPDNFEGIRYCFSPGVGPEASFEKYLSETYGIKCFLADASVQNAPIQNNNFEFDKKFLGKRNDETFMTLQSWVEAKLGDTDNNLVLQMDIEEGEYDVLTSTPDEVLHRFQYLIIEFHEFHRMILKDVHSIFTKLYKHFSIAHVHPNNNVREIVFFKGVSSRGTFEIIEVPAVIEVTFIRNDMIASLRSDTPVKLPHTSDMRNVTRYEDLKMPERWWKQPSS